ncbi:MAG: hypothetical protein AABZ74_17250 [Cyanobacteriota bacterium]
MENKFKFKKNDVELEFSGERDFVEQQIKEWKTYFLTLKDNDSKNLDNLENNYNNSKNHQISVIKNISFDDFFKLKNPETNMDKVVVAAYYLERYEKYQSFTEIDLYKILNIEDITTYVNKSIHSGFIEKIANCEPIEKYTLTYSGEIYVKDGLQ